MRRHYETMPRPFTEGLFVKECLVKASDILYPGKTKLLYLKASAYPQIQLQVGSQI